MPAELTAAESFEAWATGAAATVTAIAIFIGGGWALWRYVLPSPFEPTWEIVVRDCWVRRLESGRFKYGVEVNLTNTSMTPYVVDKVSFSILLPGQKASELEEAEVGDLMFKPRVQRRIFPWKEGGQTLHQVVVVLGVIEFRQRRLLGLLGWRQHTLKIQKDTPVDAQSVALYVGS